MMFKRKSMYVAVLAGLGAVGVAGTASAVHVNPDGLGQVLIYPYYTVRNATAGVATGAYNTLVSVTNTTATWKAVKVRFLEGKNSKEVLDFNLFLSPHDIWTGSVEPTAAGAMLLSDDKSCTNGVIPATGQPFSDIAYASDNETTSMDRVREGYIEIIEMGEIPAAYPIADDPITGVGSLRTAVTHVNGVAPCTPSVLAAVDVAPGDQLAGLLVGTGGLLGGASLVNPVTGTDYTYDAVALDNFRITTAIGNASSSSAPTIGSGNSLTSEVFVGSSIETATWAVDDDAVGAALMHNNLINEFVLDAGTASATDWIVTFPNKSRYVTTDTCNGGVACSAAATTRDHNRVLQGYLIPATYATTQPFLFNEDFGLGGSCDGVGLTQYSREEQTPVGAGGFSPGVGAAAQTLCWEANVISFNRATVSPLTSGILGSTNVKNIETTYANGWVNLAFNQAPVGVNAWGRQMLVPTSSATNGVADVPTRSSYGLPVVGFMVQDFVNGNLGGVLSNYGGNFAHKFSRCVEGQALHIAAHVSTSNCR